MTAIQQTLLTALVIMLVDVVLYVWVLLRCCKNILMMRAVLALPEDKHTDALVVKYTNAANKWIKLEIKLYPFTSQIRYMFIPTLIIFGLTYLF